MFIYLKVVDIIRFIIFDVQPFLFFLISFLTCVVNQGVSFTFVYQPVRYMLICNSGYSFSDIF